MLKHENLKGVSIGSEKALEKKASLLVGGPSPAAFRQRAGRMGEGERVMGARL